MIIVTVKIYSKLRNKTLFKKIVMVFTIILLILFLLVRVENLFIKYDSPTKAFEHSGIQGNIVKVVDAENSTLVIFRKKNADSALLLNKINGKWKNPVISGKTHMITLKDMSLVILYKEKRSDNYYVLVSTSNNQSVTDSKNTAFEEYEEYKRSDNILFESLKGKEYAAFVGELPENYYLKIGNNKFDIWNEIT
ncbi:MAG: hypothetical protein NC320_01370 [Clostridium sp.]|nr:hypothetical protein [Clostridium sp.]MCM1547821.1 hypothetical protein [Ruminococcus sp.]